MDYNNGLRFCFCSEEGFSGPELRGRKKPCLEPEKPLSQVQEYANTMPMHANSIDNTRGRPPQAAAPSSCVSYWHVLAWYWHPSAPYHSIYPCLGLGGQIWVPLAIVWRTHCMATTYPLYGDHPDPILHMNCFITAGPSLFLVGPSFTCQACPPFFFGL